MSNISAEDFIEDAERATIKFQLKTQIPVQMCYYRYKSVYIYIYKYM